MDYVHSTSGMVRHSCKSQADVFIIGTKAGLLYQLEEKSPDKKFYPLSEDIMCINMKKTGPDDVINALEHESPVVKVLEGVAVRAERAIRRMLEIRV